MRQRIDDKMEQKTASSALRATLQNTVDAKDVASHSVVVLAAAPITPQPPGTPVQNGTTCGRLGSRVATLHDGQCLGFCCIKHEQHRDNVPGNGGILYAKLFKTGITTGEAATLHMVHRMLSAKT